ncbi:hypothetical protein ABZ891_26590 [Streptomyces sp. NPDC047023]|uniref:hypothetical protein n=1 Tax=Streptomyces sp. NPDC047023 TaxID=3155139 RepID=UPI0033E45291
MDARRRTGSDSSTSPNSPSPPSKLRGRVEAHLDAIASALPRTHHYERELTVAAGETAALAGWLAWDLGDHQAARNYYRVTAECAKAAGHPALRALAFGYAS